MRSSIGEEIKTNFLDYQGCQNVCCAFQPFTHSVKDVFH